MTTTHKHRILITSEGGVIQDIENIPAGTVIEVRDFDRDGDKSHPSWSEEHQAFVGECHGEQPAASYRYEHATDGIDETFDILTPTGERLVSVHFWSDPERAEAKAKLITDALNSQPTVAEPQAFFAEHQQIAIVWSVEDVQEVRPSLDRDQAWEVLKAAEHHHDCNYGLTWDNLKTEADHLFPQNAA